MKSVNPVKIPSDIKSPAAKQAGRDKIAAHPMQAVHSATRFVTVQTDMKKREHTAITAISGMLNVPYRIATIRRIRMINVRQMHAAAEYV